MALLFILLLWSRFCHLLIVSRFLSLGLGSCLVFKPFKPRPVFGFCLCPSFLCLVCFVAAVFSLVFSFSQALGKPKPPLGGLGFPLCFFDLDAIAHFDPYSDLRTYTMATPSICLFFLFAVVVARFLVQVCLGLSWWCCVSSWFVSGGGSLHAF